MAPDLLQAQRIRMDLRSRPSVYISSAFGLPVFNRRHVVQVGHVNRIQVQREHRPDDGTKSVFQSCFHLLTQHIATPADIPVIREIAHCILQANSESLHNIRRDLGKFRWNWEKIGKT